VVVVASLLALSWSPARPAPETPEPVIGDPVSATGGGVEPAYTGCDAEIAPVFDAAYEQQVVELVNAERANQGLPPLKRVTALDDAARYHALDMGQDNYFSHDTYDGATYVCSWSARIGKFYIGWNSLAENIAAGYSSPQSVMSAWMNSSGHRANILSTSRWEIGVGYAQVGGSAYTRYWVQDFGRRGNVFPLVINREAAATDTRDVALYIYGSFAEMRLRNDDGPWAAWQPFQTNVNWTLASGVGTRTVAAELRGGANGSTTRTSSDTIYLTTSDPALGNLPATVGFLFSIPEQRLFPASVQVTPANTGTDDALNWTLTTQGGWFSVSPGSGSTPASFSITPTTFPTDTAAAYTGAITVTVTSPSGVLGSPHRIGLSLQVFNAPLAFVYLPGIWK
jgi:uncharacterized protein YkwD